MLYEQELVPRMCFSLPISGGLQHGDALRHLWQGVCAFVPITALAGSVSFRHSGVFDILPAEMFAGWLQKQRICVRFWSQRG